MPENQASEQAHILRTEKKEPSLIRRVWRANNKGFDVFKIVIYWSAKPATKILNAGYQRIISCLHWGSIHVVDRVIDLYQVFRYARVC